MTDQERDPEAEPAADDATGAVPVPDAPGTPEPAEPEASGDDGDAVTDTEAASAEHAAALDEADEPVDDGVGGEEPEADDVDEDDDAATAVAPAAAAAAVAAAPTGRGAKGRPPAKGAAVAPSVSEQAVHVNDRASAVFVIVVVAVFALIFVNALLLGHKGLFSGLLPHATP